MIYALASLMVLVFLMYRSGPQVAQGFGLEACVAAWFTYVVVVRCAYSEWMGDWTYIGRDLTAAALPAAWASAAALCALIVGYHGRLSVARKGRAFPKLEVAKPIDFRSDRVSIAQYRVGQILILLGVGGFGVWLIAEGDVSLFFSIGSSAADQQLKFSTGNYAYAFHLSGLLTSGFALGYAATRRLTFFLLFSLVLASAIYFLVGLRYKLLMLWGCFLVLYLLNATRGKRLRIISVALPVVLIVFAVLGLTRNYFAGVDLSRLQSTDMSDLLESALGESVIFFGFAAILDAIPSTFPYVGLAPFINLLVMPIPRFIYPDKPYPEYLYLIGDSIGTAGAEFAGTAIPIFGEYYVAFGWPGMLLAMVIFGALLATVSRHFAASPNSILRRAFYSLAVPFTFYSLSRGYVAQIAVDLAFYFIVPWLVFGASRAIARRDVLAQTE